MESGSLADRRLCLIVPCYNEAARLNVFAFRTFLERSRDARLLFVDDGSSDDTLQVLRALTAGFEDRAALLPYRPNQGKAEAVRRGILHALNQFQPQFTGFWDADLATPLNAISTLLEVLERDQSKDMVFGARVKLLGRHVERRAIRHYLGRAFATVVSNLLRLPIYDSQCGAKVFRVTADTGKIFAEPFLSKWVFDVEIIARYLVLRDRNPSAVASLIYEYPLESWVDVAGSKVKPSDFLTALLDVLRIQRAYLS